MRPVLGSAAAGHESVWDYPRPAIGKPSGRHISIEHRRLVLADAHAAVRTLETSHPPSCYLLSAYVLLAVLRRSTHGSFCEWKGQATYDDVEIAGDVLRNVAWSYPEPSPEFAAVRDHITFYAAPCDDYLLDRERATPQPGGFHDGWITPELAGTFKGRPGSRF